MDGRHLIIQRTDKGDGTTSLIGFNEAVRKIRAAYFGDPNHDNDGITRGLAFGYPYETSFAVYQHRDFVVAQESNT